MDILSIVLLSCGVFSVLTGKFAARKFRFWPLWCLYGALLGPIALGHAIVSPKLAACPSCGRSIHIKLGRECKYCKWKPAPQLKNSAIASDINKAAGFKLGDTLKSAGKKLDSANCKYKMTEQLDAGGIKIICEERNVFGFPAIVSGNIEEGKVTSIAFVYSSDPEYGIYYSLRQILVSKYGKPDCEPCESGHSDNWRTKRTLISLSTGTSPESKEIPSTCLIYGQNEQKNDIMYH